MNMDYETDGYVCAFCGDDIPAITLDLRRVTVTMMNGSPPLQELFAHRACLAQAISPKIPLGEVLDESP